MKERVQGKSEHELAWHVQDERNQKQCGVSVSYTFLDLHK